MIKRTFDIISSSLGLVLLSPVLLIVACLIKREDGGPVFYKGTRIGQSGTPFKMFKFRTMVVNADQLGGASTSDDDRRITNTGKMIRKWKLDEIPQLINVFLGEMSVVGPRPEVKHYVDMFTEQEKQILSVRPGITDWASLWNSDEGAALKGSADPEKTYMEEIRPTKLKFQLQYVQEHSLWTDFKIVWMTLWTVLSGKRFEIPIPDL